MDNNTWQIKCGSSGWAGSCSSSSSSSSSSSQLLHGSRNQMERSAGQCRHPYVMTPISSMDSGIGREPTVFNSMYLASCKSGKTELRNSFLALLSGPSSQVHYENKQLPNSTSGKLPLLDTGPIASNVDGGVSLIPAGGLLHHHKGNNNMANGAGLHPVNSSAEVLAYGGSFVSPFHDSHQTTNSNRQDIVKPDYQHANRGNETGTSLSSSQWGWFGSSSPSTFGHFNTTNVQASVKVPSDAKLVVSDFSAASVKGHPFVFCLATKGELLLSNTGLLGVLCCCHGLHMSVRKFCEHSGLFAVNPGEAVRLESGETIAQWRRLYFLKSGIRIPDDNTGWEWPERIPAAVSLVKCKTTGLSMSKNSDMFQMVDPFVGVVISGQPCKNVASQNASQMGHTVLEKTFNNAIQQDGHSQEGSIVFQQSLLGNTQNNLAGASDMQTRQMIKESPTAGGIAPSKSSLEKGQDDNVYQSISDYINCLTKGGGTFVSNQNMGNFKCPGTVSDVNRSSSLREGFTIDGDAIPSNIELRLGQPSQQRCTLEGLVVPAVPSEQFGAIRDCNKSMFQAPFHDGNTRVAGESRQTICYAPSDTNFRRQNQSQSNLIRHVVPGSSNVVDAAKLEQLNVDIAKSSVISMFLSRYNGATQRELQPVVDGNMLNSDPITHHVPQCESYIVHNSSDFPKNKCDERQGNINVARLVPLSNMDKDKVPHKTGTCSHATEKADPKFYNKHITGASPFNGVIGGCHLLNSLNVNKDNIPNLHRTSGTPHLSDVGNLSNQFEKGTCFGGNSRLDHALLRSPHCSNVADGSYLPISAVSMGFSSTTSIGRQNLTPLANKKGDANPCIVDENLKLHALRLVLDHSKQAHAGTFREMNSGHERVYGLSTLEMQRQTSTYVPSSASIELKDETHFMANQDASEASVKHLLACSNHFMDGGMDKLVAASGINNWCNFSTSSQPIPLRSMESDTQYPPYGSLCNKQHMLRFGGTEINKCGVPVHEYSHIQTNPNLPKECSCPVHSVSLSENSACVGKAPVDSSRGHVGNNALLQGPPIVENIHMMPGDNAEAIDPCENFRRKGVMLNKCQASQWRDVPSKQKGVCNAPCIDRPAEVSNVRRNVDDQPIASAGMEVDKIQEAESLNEQQMSNFFSGCSAPAVTEVTGEVNNAGSCTMDAEDVKYVNDHVFDEGSGIAKCWSSNETFDSERSTETVNGSANIDIAKVALSSDLPAFTSRSPVDGIRSGSLRLKKVPNLSPAGCAVYNKQLEGNFRKQKKPTKWKRLDASFPASGLSSVHYDSPISHNLSSSGGKKRSSSHKHGLQISCGIPSNGHSNHKRKRSTLNSAKTLSRKRDQHELYCHHGGWENHSQKQLRDEMQICRKSKLLGEKKLKWCCNADVRRQFPQKETNQASSGKNAINDSARSVQHLDLPSYQMGACDRQPRPVVCGNSGIISNGKLIEGRAKPTKIVSLSIVLKKARSCSLIEQEEPVPSSILGTKNSCLKSEDGYSDFESEMGMETSLFEKKKERINRNEVCLAELSTLPKDSDSGCPKLSKEDGLQGFSGTPFKSKFKETRKRSLDELSGKSKLSKRFVGIRLGSAKLCIRRSLRCSFRTKHRLHGLSYLSKRANNYQCKTGELSEGIAKKSIKTHKCQTFIIDSDAFCCVCGSSNKDDINSLLQCSGCSIRVHQACYGVSKVPKGRWCCRPCKADSRNIVCVLCGYGGGAMTRALKCRNIVKSFLKAWNIADHCSSVMFKKDWHKQTDVLKSPSSLHFNSEVHNSLTDGVFDPTIKQWVHMVCGLWTPGTRCPNVDTMSAFDVSGASRPPKDVVCSMCNQFGGSYIQCRVLNCTVYFHPWCAHQKGLLQSEVEGVDNEKVGFYGRCMLHAMHNGYDPNNDPVETKVNVEKEEFSCARTECYRGRKKDGFRNAHYGRSNDNGKCLVPQEQINAWLHINGQKPSARGLLKPQSSDVEYDCRKEYARYKQAKGWKHLVVYKSGIHALGLYTSQFIPRGAMVVEYVGEIVGLRVADKREIEYQSGRKVQYKSACYFFRIDKEHIIDATRKGGIARFVNHSCLPNCVAKVISVRNEKKVVFFAERDINPGEEITYDYHFNHEDEGKKIPCFCNSKNCRRYLN